MGEAIIGRGSGNISSSDTFALLRVKAPSNSTISYRMFINDNEMMNFSEI